MCPDSLNGGCDLAFGEPELPQDRGHPAGGINDVIPCRQRRRVFRAVADEDPQVVHPGGGKEHVIVARLTLGEPFGELVKPGLVAELVRRLRLGADVFNNGFPVSGFSHGARIAAAWVVSNPGVRRTFVNTLL
jgi:hypothetical protein